MFKKLLVFVAVTDNDEDHDFVLEQLDQLYEDITEANPPHLLILEADNFSIEPMNAKYTKGPVQLEAGLGIYAGFELRYKGAIRKMTHDGDRI